MSNQPKIEDNQHAIKTKFENICKNFINLLLAFVSFCRQLDELIFQKNFYELLYKFVSKYDDNYIYFKNYLIMLSLEIFF